MSFNFGPTLLSWLEEKEPDVYRAILTADADSRRRFSGHGSALAQPYNHMILPLANARDRRTQVAWGMRDFVHRFGREPEGMWLPETAVDTASLEALAEAGIVFTILAPHQASHVRKLGDEDWQDVRETGIDPTMPYRVTLPSGRSIALFFYDGPISRAVAFERLLSRGEQFAERLTGGFSESRAWPQLVHIATDGETYGHHHRHGDMALAYALHTIESGGLARLTNYGEFLEKHPPTHEVRIVENTSWSCAHGVERWRSDCGCHSGSHPDWNQAWRAPLREALDWLRDALAPLYGGEGGRAVPGSVGGARRLRARPPRSHAGQRRPLPPRARRPRPPARRGADDSLEAPRAPAPRAAHVHELRLVLRRHRRHRGAADHPVRGPRAPALPRLFGAGFEEPFLAALEKAKGNAPEARDGRQIYEESVRPAMVSLEKVGAHYGVSSLFSDYGDVPRLLLPGRSGGRQDVLQRAGPLRSGPGPRDLRDHRGIRNRDLRRAAPGRPQPLRAASSGSFREESTSGSPARSPRPSAGRT